jgi:multidrug transporter EmrE-like cation transporter
MTAYIPLILFSVLTNFFSQILLKKGMTSIEKFDVSFSGVLSAGGNIIFNIYIVMGLFVMVISMASHLVVLSRVPISFAYPFLGLSFVLVAIYGSTVLAEPMGIWRIIGILLIFSGVSLIARS